MKGLLLLGLVGAAIYGALVLSDDLLPRDPAKDAFARQSLGDPSDRQLRSWGTDLPSLASSSSQRASVTLPSRCDPSIKFPFSRLRGNTYYHKTRRHSIPADRMGQGGLSR